MQVNNLSIDETNSPSIQNKQRICTLFGKLNENAIYVKSDFVLDKERDLLNRFSKHYQEHPNFKDSPENIKEFAKEFEQQILRQICQEVEHLNITIDDGDDLEAIRPDL